MISLLIKHALLDAINPFEVIKEDVDFELLNSKTLTREEEQHLQALQQYLNKAVTTLKSLP